MIHHTNQLSNQQLQEVIKLSELCKKNDGNIPNLYFHILNQYRMFPATLLYYHEEQLAGFLSVYFFYEHAVELSLIIHPQYRRQKIGQRLLQAIMPLLQQGSYEEVICSVPSQQHKAWLLTKGASYLHSEYYMMREDSFPILSNQNAMLSFKTATVEDSAAIQLLDDWCFPDKKGAYSEQINHLLNNQDYQIILAIQDKEPIGKAHIRWQDKSATLSDIAINPALQGKGLGSALITYCINEALRLGISTLHLDVETHNKKALALYSRLGFTVKNACDFWSIKNSSILSLINGKAG